eukprot:2005142-Prorocentrum_lima.AAC.1
MSGGAPAVAREVKESSVLSALKNLNFDGSDPKKFTGFRIKAEGQFDALGYSDVLAGKDPIV